MAFYVGDKVKTKVAFSSRGVGVTKGTVGKIIRVNGPKHNQEYTVELVAVNNKFVQIICYEREIAKVGMFG